MYLPEILRQRRPALSIEIFPPKTAQGDEALFNHLNQLAVFQPAFVSCTYGAGGTTQSRTVELCQSIQERYSIPATAHFTCVGSTRQELVDWLAMAVAAGVKNIMALRGDAPQGQEGFQRKAGGLGYANELVTLIREHQPQLGIGVAGYPEKHTEAPDLKTDLDHLKRKVDAGADAVFTQLFYVNANFLKFRDECTARRIEIPVIPGIMPITEFARIKRITAMCGAVFPTELAARLEAVQDDAAAQFELGVEYAITQCRELLEAGVPGIHFYALNKSEACHRILEALGVAPRI